MTDDTTTSSTAKSTTNTTGNVDDVVIERVLDAPIDTVWAMWTEAEHFAAWYGPTGATVPTAEMDVVVGGRRRIAMRMPTPDGDMTMWFAGEYVVVDPPVRLVYTESMADETGRVLSARESGMPEGHPVVTEVLVELADLGRQTKMVMTHRGVPADSGGAMGWKMALDQLEAHIAGQ